MLPIEINEETVQRAQTGVHTTLNGLFTAIFALIGGKDGWNSPSHLINRESLEKFSLSNAHYYLFSAAAVLELMTAALDFVEYRLTPDGKQKDEVLIRAGISTVKALTITVAVIGALFVRALLIVSAPILFTFALAMGTLYHFARFIHHAQKAQEYKKLDDREKYEMHCQRRDYHAKNTAISLALTILLPIVFFFTAPAAAIAVKLGTITSGVGTLLGVYNFFSHRKKPVAIQNDSYNDYQNPLSRDFTSPYA